MKKVLVILGISCLIGACASPQPPRNALVTSLSVGVQNDIQTASQIAKSLFPNSDSNLEITPHSLEYAPVPMLQDGLRNGQYDVVVGLLESLQNEMQKDKKLVALNRITMRYFVLPERKNLHRASKKTDFFSKVKAVGYVSIGEVGNINSAMIRNHSHAYSFEPCGALLSCIDMLRKNQIDTFATTGLSPSESLREALEPHGIRIVHADFYELATIGLVMNGLSLNSLEMQQLAAMFWQNMPSINTIAAQADEHEQQLRATGWSNK